MGSQGADLFRPSPSGSETSRRRTPVGRALVIIPAFNEEQSLGQVLSDLTSRLAELPGSPIDVLVVSDGSTDATAAIARSSGVAVLELAFNLGIGGALRTGFRFASERGYQAAVQFDADGQHDSRSIETLLGSVGTGADLVIGSRFADGAQVSYEVGMVRRTAMKLLERLVRVLSKQRFSDTSSGFRGFSAPMIEYFADHYPVEYMDSVEALVMAINSGFDVREVPVTIFERMGGAPSTRGWRLAYYYTRLVVILLVSYVRPSSRPDLRAAPSEANPLPVDSHGVVSP